MKSIYGLFLIKKIHSYSIKSDELISFFTYSLPFILYVIIGNGTEYVDGIIVKNVFPIDTFPIFRYGARELPLSTILFGALVTSAIPLFIEKGQTSLTTLKKKVRYLIWILFPITGVLLLMSPFLYQLFYNDLYVDSAKIFNIYLLIIFSRAWLPQIILISRDYLKPLIIISGIEIIINIFSSLLLVQKIGLAGIAYGTLIAYFIQKGIMVLYLYKKEGVVPKEYMPIKTYTILSSLLLLIFLISQHYLF